jgi:hypothetical protein
MAWKTYESVLATHFSQLRVHAVALAALAGEA